MLNNGDLRLISLAFYDLYRSGQAFNKVKISIESKKENGSFNAPQLIEIEQEYKKRKAQLEGFKNSIFKLSKIISPILHTNLMNAIGNEIASLDMLIKDTNDYINTRDPKYIESVVYGFNLEKEQSELLSNAVLSCEKDLGMYLFSKALNNEISLDELESLIRNFEVDSSIYKTLSDIIIAINLRKEQSKTDLNLNEIVGTEPKNEIMEEKSPIEKSGVEKTRELTLEEKVNNVQYRQGVNMNAEVQTLIAKDSLDNILAQIKALESKEKLTIRETIKLHTLKSEELGMQNYMNKLDNSALSISERRIEKTTNKINSIETNLRTSQENYKGYTSKTMRFFSARYQEQLQVNILALQQKNGILAAKQRASSTVKFDKEAKKISRNSKISGLINGISDITIRKIEGLKKFKEDIILEMTNLKQDATRFRSQITDLSQLQESSVVVPDNIISFEELRKMYGRDHQLSA